MLANFTEIDFARLDLPQSGAHAQWEPGAPRWVYVVDDWGPWVLGVIVLVLIVRALLQRRRYSAVAVFDTRAQERVHDALMAAEAKTVGEIVPVVVERSDGHPNADWLSALTFLLVGSALLEGWLPWHAPHWLILCQLALGAIGFGLSRALPGWKRMFVSETRATEMASEQATQEFHRLQLHQTHARTGVLLFVSLFERRVIVLGDIGIHAKVGDELWAATRDAILEGAAQGRLEAGLVQGIERCGGQLERHFPWVHGDRNEIPDRVVVRRE
jgi:putative membrane protein